MRTQGRNRIARVAAWLTLFAGAAALAAASIAAALDAGGGLADPNKPGRDIVSERARRVKSLGIMLLKGQTSADGERLLLDRARELETLIDEDPAKALDAALDDDALAKLARAYPAAAARLEARARFQGPVEYTVADDFELGTSGRALWMTLGAERVRVRFSGKEPEGIEQATNAQVDGIRVGGSIAATGGAVIVAPDTGGTCSAIGVQHVVVILVDYPGNPNPYSRAEAMDTFFAATPGRSLDGFWREASYNRTSATGDVFGPYPMSRSYACDSGGPEGLRAEALAAADADVNFALYDRVFIVHPDPGNCAYGGLGTLACTTLSSPGETFTASTTWLRGDILHNVGRDSSVFYAAHEGGHNLGLNHALALYFDGNYQRGESLGLPAATGNLVGYGDPFSSMGRDYPTAFHYSAQDKVRLGWLDPGNVRTVTSSDTVTIVPYELPSTGVQAVRVKRGDDSSYLWLESRTSAGLYDCQPGAFTTCPGALGHYEYPSTVDPPGSFFSCPTCTTLIDFTPTDLNFQNAPLPPGTPWTDPYTGLGLSVTSVADGISVAATFNPPLCNRPAQIAFSPTSLTTTNGGHANFQVTITNPDDPSCLPATYQLSTSHWPGFPSPSSVTLAPGAASSPIALNKTVPASTEQGTYTVDLIATQAGISSTGTAQVTVNSNCTLGDPVVTLSPDSLSTALNENARFTMTVQDTDSAGCGVHQFLFSSTLPAGWSGSISPGFSNMAGGNIATATVTKIFPAGTHEGDTNVVNAIATSNPGTPPASPHVGSDTAQLIAAAPCVHANPTLSTTPRGQIGTPGGDVWFDGQVKSNDSPTCAPVTYTINVTGPGGWTVFPVSDCIPACPPQIVVPAGQTGVVSYGATLPSSAQPGGYTIHMNVTSASGFGSTFGLVGVNPVCIDQAPSVVLSPVSAPANAGQPAGFTATVTNNDFGSQCTPQTFSLAAGIPAGWTASLTPSVTVAPGASVQVPFYATSPVTATSGSYGVSVTALGGDGAATGGAAVQVTAVCLRGTGPTVTLSPDAQNVAAGQTASYVVTLVDNDMGAACTGYNVTLQTIQPAGFGHSIVPMSLFMPPGGTVTAAYSVTPDAGHAGVDVTLIVNALRGNTIGEDSTGDATARVEPLRTLEAGYGHSISAHPDGTVWAWGWNQYGQLGDATLTNRNGPVRSGSLTGVVEAGAGVFHSIALESDGSVRAWGGNADGQLGDGTTTQRSVPAPVAGLTGVVAVAAGFSHNLALRSDGTVWAWGDNTSGQIGDGTTIDRPAPVQVPGLSGVAAVAAGAYHSVAVRSDGTVWTWGSNAEGQLGDGTHTDRASPAAVPGLGGVTRASCGAYFSMVVLADGTMKGWGHNFYGQLGDGTTDERDTPVTVSALTSVTRVAAGSGFTLAVRADGSVWSFGQNVFGELGDGTTTNRSTPQPIAGLAGIVEVAAGEDHSLARDANGRVYGWGKNLYGQIGAGPSPQTTPIVVVDESQPAPLGLVSPVGGEIWQPGSARTVSWTGQGPISVALSLDAGASYTTLVASTSLQDVPITVPSNWTTARGRLRIDRVGTPASSAQTGAYIRIYPTQTHPWLTMTVDATPQVTGEFASIAVDKWGRTGIAYFDRTNGDLKFALRTGTTWTIDTVDAANATGWYASLAFGADGSPRISYMDGTRTFLRYASKATGTWVAEDVADTNCTLPTSLGFDASDRPFIAIQDCATTRVRVFARSGSWSEIKSLSGASPSLRMSGNLPRISYFLHSTNPTQLHVLSASGTFPSFTWTDETVPGGGGANWNSIAVDSQGNPDIAFYEATSKSLRMARKIGGAWSVDIVDATAGDVGNWNSVALDPASRPRIGYLANGLVKIAEWSGSAWSLDAVDASGDTPAATALAVDAAGNDRVAYFDTPGGDLRYAISQPDVTAPAAPALAFGAGRTTVAVSWTAPGDDGASGTASVYDLRRSAAPITDANFAQASVVPTGPPGPAGTPECASLMSLPRCTTQYFALRVLDDLGNASPLAVGQVATTCSGSQEVFCN